MSRLEKYYKNFNVGTSIYFNNLFYFINIMSRKIKNLDSCYLLQEIVLIFGIKIILRVSHLMDAGDCETG